VKEVVSKRTATSKTFDLGGGKFRLEAGGHAHHGPPGAMVETSRAFLDDPTEFRSGQHPCDIRLPNSYAQPLRFGHGRDTVIVRALDFNTPPSFGVLEDDVVTYEQAYDGIDVLYRLTDRGIKTEYIITSNAGQREISFEVSGDFEKYHKAPWYEEDDGVEVEQIFIPFTLEGSTLTYDLTFVPIGAVVDPTLETSIATGADDVVGEASSSSWNTVRTATTGTVEASANFIAAYGIYYSGTTYYIARAWFKFPGTSELPADATVSSVLLSGTSVLDEGTGEVMNVVSTTLTSWTGTSGINPANFGTERLGSSTGGEAVGTAISISIDTDAVTKNGTTYFGLRGDNDLDNTTPSGENRNRMASYENTTYDPPTLTVEYEIPATGKPYYYRNFVQGG